MDATCHERCAHLESRVVDSRQSDLPHVLKRRRHECLACGERFTTIELPIDRYAEILNLTEQLDKLTSGWR